MGFFNFLDKMFNYDPNEDFKETMQKQQQEKFEKEDKQGVRDKIIISKSFYLKQINKTENEIQIFKSDYKDFKKKNGESADTSGIVDSLNIRVLNLIGAKYSKGEPVKEIIHSCPALMETASRNWSIEIDYSIGNKNLIRLKNSVSLGILGNVDNSYFEDLSKVMQEKRFSDFLIDYLVNSQIPTHPIEEKLIVEDNKSINFLIDIIKTEEKQEAEKKLFEYLNKHYYTKENLDYDYKKHEFENGRIYFGYWCWEAAALVKIKNLDDSNFKNNKYYPYDFVHWDKQEPPKKNTFLID